jgi:hypothetical protein
MRAIVKSGARLLLVDLWTDPTHTEPSAAALMSGTFLLISGEGQSYSEQEADGWLELTKWRKLERKPLTASSSRRLLGRSAFHRAFLNAPSVYRGFTLGFDYARSERGEGAAGGAARRVRVSRRLQDRLFAQRKLWIRSFT